MLGYHEYPEHLTTKGSKQRRFMKRVQKWSEMDQYAVEILSKASTFEKNDKYLEIHVELDQSLPEHPCYH